MKLSRCYHIQQYPETIKTNEYYDLVDITGRTKGIECTAKCLINHICQKIKLNLNDLYITEYEK